MSGLITDAMVKAATVASINVSLAPYAESITTTTDLQGGGEALAEMRAALEAVAPHIVAQALRDAATDTDGLLDLLVAEDDSQFAYGSAHGIGPDGSVEFMTDWLTARADRIEEGDS